MSILGKAEIVAMIAFFTALITEGMVETADTDMLIITLFIIGIVLVAGFIAYSALTISSDLDDRDEY